MSFNSITPSELQAATAIGTALLSTKFAIQKAISIFTGSDSSETRIKNWNMGNQTTNSYISASCKRLQYYVGSDSLCSRIGYAIQAIAGFANAVIVMGILNQADQNKVTQKNLAQLGATTMNAQVAAGVHIDNCLFGNATASAAQLALCLSNLFPELIEAKNEANAYVQRLNFQLTESKARLNESAKELQSIRDACSQEIAAEQSHHQGQVAQLSNQLQSQRELSSSLNDLRLQNDELSKQTLSRQVYADSLSLALTEQATAHSTMVAELADQIQSQHEQIALGQAKLSASNSNLAEQTISAEACSKTHKQLEESLRYYKTAYHEFEKQMKEKVPNEQEKVTLQQKEQLNHKPLKTLDN